MNSKMYKVFIKIKTNDLTKMTKYEKDISNWSFTKEMTFIVSSNYLYDICFIFLCEL